MTSKEVPVIALTGNIATGKSTAALLLSRKGAMVIDADAIAHEMYARNPDLIKRMVEQFGEGILDPQGHIDRAALGTRIFASATLRHMINELTHPYIRKQMLEDHASALQSNPPLIIHDIPLLYESKLSGIFPRVLVIAAPMSVQEERLVTQRHLSLTEARARINAQLPIEDKCQHATWCCENTGSIAELEHQLDRLWPEFVQGGPQPRLDLLTTIA
ncbi:MAG: dephospho-CoA kinase [Candidatus Dormibacteria bacterium]